MNREQKKSYISEMTAQFENSEAVLVTHYQRLLNYIAPDKVHVLIDGKIVKSGGKDLALELESKGYDWVREVTDTKAVRTDT